MVPKPRANEKLSIPLPFDEALKAALKVEPPERIEKGRKARVTTRSKRKLKP